MLTAFPLRWRVGRVWSEGRLSCKGDHVRTDPLLGLVLPHPPASRQQVAGETVLVVIPQDELRGMWRVSPPLGHSLLSFSFCRCRCEHCEGLTSHWPRPIIVHCPQPATWRWLVGPWLLTVQYTRSLYNGKWRPPNFLWPKYEVSQLNWTRRQIDK